MREERPVSVTALVRYLKGTLENDARLSGVLVEGEISNFSAYRSGHWYFSLKDAGAAISCVMFASSNRRMKFMPKDGDKVLAGGSVSVYEGRGSLQLIVTGMQPSGIGDLYLQFEALKKKLDEEGLFDPAHKKPIPPYPMNVGLITGRNTEARADVLTTMQRRWPVAVIHEIPVLVQGDQSAMQIVDALKTMDPLGYDVILLVRGGGSIEDLWSFNDERVARTIYAMKTPVITGIGHEMDFTIADFVSDLRANTPTAAAERCAPDIHAVMQQLQEYRKRMTDCVQNDLEDERERLKTLSERPVLKQPERLYMQKEMQLQYLKEQFLRLVTNRSADLRQQIRQDESSMAMSFQKRIADERAELSQMDVSLRHSVSVYDQKQKQRLSSASGLLDAYSPLKVLSRGYSIVTDHHQVVRSYKEVQKGDQIDIRLKEGTLQAQVTDRKDS